MQIVTVKTSTEYPIIIGMNILKTLGENVKKYCSSGTAVIVTDDIVYELYGKICEESIAKSGYNTEMIIIKNGESSKNAKEYIRILNILAEKKVTRTDCLIALGGGVVGDLTGFVAATYLRGIKFVQVPTTLLAAVDSSVGGKTGIDLDSGKNLAGAFYQPAFVLCDYSTLKTLPQKVLCDGCAEVIKYGIIRDKKLFYMMQDNEHLNLEEIITRCVKIKAEIVNEDERDLGIRQILNFGHTFGHGVEAASNYEISHGNAVAIGMKLMMQAEVQKKWCSIETFEEVLNILKKYEFDLEIKNSVDEIYEIITSDKKRKGKNIDIAIATEIGRSVLKRVSMIDLRKILTLAMEDSII